MGRTVLASTRIPFAETISPTAGRAVWLVALRELTDQMTSLRFLIVALLAVGLTPLAIYVGARDFKNRLAEYDRLQVEKQKQSWKDGPTEMGDRENLLLLRAVRAPEPLSVLVRGLDAAMPAYWDFSTAGIASGPSASRPRRLADMLGQLDLEFLVRVVLGLLAILLAFDAVVGEKELGTLRAVLSQSLARPAFLGGKLAGGAVTLLVPLAASFLVALLSAKLFGVDLLGAHALVKTTLLLAASATYLLCFYALGLLISCLTSSQRTSLVVLLVTWVIGVLAVPPLATFVAQAMAPAPPAYAIEAQKAALAEQLHRDTAREMGEIYARIGGERAFSDPNVYDQNKQAIDQAVAPVMATSINKRRRLVGEIDNDAERHEERQNEVSALLMGLSPAATFARGSADLAGTGDALYAAWLEGVRRQQSRLDSTLFGDPVFLTFVDQSGGAAMAFARRKPPILSQLPMFVPPQGDALTALARALPSLGLLIVYTGVFIVGSFVAFARYDVR
jgi:ABC-type transport system involved in multi-copper enzyme maturation permease subunit